jgi:antitoxin (DNA-binding transcriptional repressor) of toxin-antitoxin stability system
MRTVGIRELKATLSSQLATVRRGEILLVTDRGVVIAEIRPPGSTEHVPRDDFERRLESWVQSGIARPGPRNQRSWYPAAPAHCPDGTAQRILDELRGER